MKTTTLAAIVVLVGLLLAALWLYADRATEAVQRESVPALEPVGPAVPAPRAPEKPTVREPVVIPPPVSAPEPMTPAEMALLPTDDALAQRYEGMTQDELKAARDHLTRVVSDHKNGRVEKISILTPERIRALEHEVRWLEARIRDK